MAKTTSGSAGAHRFFGWVRAREAPQPLDAADLGTAFGLEVSLGETDDTLPSRLPETDGELREPPRF